MREKIYDTIIVGGGPTGCVLAVRLSEDAGRSVLLVEAGPDYGSDPAVGWPEEMLDSSGIRPDTHSWGHYNAPGPDLWGLHLPRAKVIGGSTTVNGVMWARPSRIDFDTWEQLGNPGWGYDRMLPYLKQSESDPVGDPELHGRDGPVPVGRVALDDVSEISRAFITSAEEIGFAYSDDFNGYEIQEPIVAQTPKNWKNGIRYNASFSYLAMARDRPNLEILADTLVDRLIVEDRVVTGIHMAEGREIHGAEVVVCGGAYDSPAILLRSGIGPADELADLGIESVVNLPGVGRSLLDHPLLDSQSGLTTMLIKPGCEPEQISFVHTVIKARSSQEEDDIDLHLYPVEQFDEDLGKWIFSCSVSLQFARSMGRVRLTSADPHASLDIDHRYFSDPADLEALCDGFELMLTLVNTPPLAEYLDGQLLGGPHLRDRDALRQAIRGRVRTTYHPSTTCKMGPASDHLAVVDFACRVRGLRGVRVVDASMFPTGPRANLHCTVVAVAERVADLMRQG